ncbi:UNVERIFIED_CONTAM: hypothetical protein K2H54_001201 [Gekko kuhli]
MVLNGFCCVFNSLSTNKTPRSTIRRSETVVKSLKLIPGTLVESGIYDRIRRHIDEQKLGIITDLPLSLNQYKERELDLAALSKDGRCSAQEVNLHSGLFS